MLNIKIFRLLLISIHQICILPVPSRGLDFFIVYFLTCCCQPSHCGPPPLPATLASASALQPNYTSQRNRVKSETSDASFALFVSCFRYMSVHASKRQPRLRSGHGAWRPTGVLLHPLQISIGGARFLPPTTTPSASAWATYAKLAVPPLLTWTCCYLYNQHNH